MIIILPIVIIKPLLLHPIQQTLLLIVKKSGMIAAFVKEVEDANIVMDQVKMNTQKMVDVGFVEELANVLDVMVVVAFTKP